MPKKPKILDLNGTIEIVLYDHLDDENKRIINTLMKRSAITIHIESIPGYRDEKIKGMITGFEDVNGYDGSKSKITITRIPE